MTDNSIHERYRQLAFAIIIQRVNDFLNDKVAEDDFYRWCTSCIYFDYLSVDGERLFLKVIKLKNKGVKNVRNEYGKTIGKEINQDETL